MAAWNGEAKTAGPPVDPVAAGATLAPPGPRVPPPAEPTVGFYRTTDVNQGKGQTDPSLPVVTIERGRFGIDLLLPRERRGVSSAFFSVD